jgi:arylsulfatase A
MTHRRRTVVKWIAWLHLCVIAQTITAVASPNFIIILADDLGYGDLGCYGSKTISTPRIDSMAAEGIRLTSFYAAAPICSPTRAALLTGRYAQRAGMPFVLFPTERKGLPPEEFTLAEILKTRGYATACIGKWHLGHQAPFRPRQQGFDYFFGLPYSNDSLKQPENEPFHPVLAPVDLPLLRNEEIVEAPVNQEPLTERYTEEAIRFIRENRTRPFFLYLPHTFPHKPLYAEEKFRGKSKGGLYGDTVEALDWSTGRILDVLKELKIDENTLIVFTSDNGAAPPGGEKFGKDRGAGGSNLPLRGRKFTSFEGGFRVPCVIRWPGHIPAGQVSAELSTVMDFVPTLAKLANAKLPRDRVLDGKNLWPILCGKKNARSDYDIFAYYLDLQLQAVRVGDWKLFLPQNESPKPTTIMYETMLKALTNHFPLRRAPELYNLKENIAESLNVAAEHPETVERLMKLARKFDAAMQKDKRPECVLTAE